MLAEIRIISMATGSPDLLPVPPSWYRYSQSDSVMGKSRQPGYSAVFQRPPILPAGLYPLRCRNLRMNLLFQNRQDLSFQALYVQLLLRGRWYRCKSLPFNISPPPIPVPIVRKIILAVPLPAPISHSASAHAFASFCRAVSTPNSSVNILVIGTLSHPGKLGGE